MEPEQISDSCYFGTEVVTCVVDQWTLGFGSEALFGVFVGGLLFLAFYVAADGEIAVPTTAVILTGTFLVPMVPGNYGRLALGIVLIGLAAGVWGVLQKYVLSPGAR